MDNITIGIPRAFTYFRYRHLWETFFNELGCTVVLSPKTDKGIIARGASCSVDESCLASKIYLGHIDYLIGKCDHILIPRISTFSKGVTVCTKFQAAYDVANNAFRERNIQILDYNIDYAAKQTEFKAFMKIGRKLKKSRFEIIRAYFMAKQSEKMHKEQGVAAQNELLAQSDNMKILVVAHGYNVYDGYVGDPILGLLKSHGAIPIIAEIVEAETAVKKAKEISPTLPWSYNQELLGAISIYKEHVDGIILVTSFPCGPDSLVNELIIRKTKDKPIMSLIVDEQDGVAGLETRIESFIDIINFKAA